MLHARMGHVLAPEQRLEIGEDGSYQRVLSNARSEDSREEVTSTRMTEGRMRMKTRMRRRYLTYEYLKSYSEESIIASD